MTIAWFVMANGNRDLDDWFAEPEPSPPRRTHPRPSIPRAQDSPPPTDKSTVDDRLGGEGADAPRPIRSVRAWSTARTTVAAGVLAVVLIVIALAAAGVFSGGARSHAVTTSTHAAPTATTPAAPSKNTTALPTTTLKPGDHGPQVRRLQRALATLGYLPGTIDGEYGSATSHALANFQRANNLNADGVLGSATLASLKHALRSAG